jgi:hypothetical protein
MTCNDAPRWLASAALGCSFIVLASCSSEDKYVVNQAEWIHQGQALVPVGAWGCSKITLPGTSNGGPTAHVGDFNFTEGDDGDSYVVKVYTDSDLLTERSYSEATLAAGTVDEFSVTTHSGAVYTLRFWGGHVCTPLDLDASAE